jgi:TRAP-type C4-dicarboxylate transport system permease small subunit
MKSLAGIVQRTSRIMDKLAGICFFSVMLLIVSNIILRGIFNKPILGTYEVVGFLSAMGIGFALAHCALQDGHIAVDFIFTKLSPKTQTRLDIILSTLVLLFWSAVFIYLIKYARHMMAKGMVSPSAEIPVYPFILMIGLGLMGLCAVLLYKLMVSLKGVLAHFSWIDTPTGLKVSDAVKRGMQ